MKKIVTLYILLASFLTSFGQKSPISITDKKELNILEIKAGFDILNYFEDNLLSKKNEYSVVRNYPVIVRKTEIKDMINYDLALHSFGEKFAVLRSLDFNYIEGFTNTGNAFFGLIFKNATILDDKSFKEKIDHLKQKLGNPNHQFRNPISNPVNKELYSWNINNLIYIAYLDNQKCLRLHIINPDEIKQVENSELGLKLIGL